MRIKCENAITGTQRHLKDRQHRVPEEAPDRRDQGPAGGRCVCEVSGEGRVLVPSVLGNRIVSGLCPALRQLRA